MMMESQKQTTMNTHPRKEMKENKATSYLVQVLSYFKVKQLSELQVFLFGKRRLILF